MPAFHDYYEILGTDPAATIDEIKRAYRRCARESHPDLHPDESRDQNTEMQLLNEAYKCLSDPRKKSAYDIEWKNYYRSRGSIAIPDADKPVLPAAQGGISRNSSGGSSPTTEKVLLIVLIILLAILVVGYGYRMRSRATRINRDNRPARQAEAPMPSPPPGNRLQDLNSQIENNPNDMNASFEAARIQLDQGQPMEALSISENALVKIRDLKKNAPTSAEAPR